MPDNDLEIMTTFYLPKDSARGITALIRYLEMEAFLDTPDDVPFAACSSWKGGFLLTYGELRDILKRGIRYL